MFLVRRLTKSNKNKRPSAPNHRASNGGAGGAAEEGHKEHPVDPSLPIETPKTVETPSPVVAKPQASSAPPGEIPIRLLLAKEFGRFLQGGVPFFELVPRDAYEEVSVAAFLQTHAKETGVISWRWGNPKPRNLEDAKSVVGDATRNPVSPDLVQFVVDRVKQDPSIKYLWLDWSCAPQYPEDMAGTMREINRSGMYYANAGHILVWCFDSLKEDAFTYSSYFERAWTLSERLYRSKGPAPLLGSQVAPPCISKALSQPSSTTRLELDKHAPPFGVFLAKAMAKLQLSATLNDGTLLPEVVSEFVSETVCGRYPLIAAALEAVEGKNGSLVRVLPADVLAGFAIALRLRAICEWTRRPDPVDDMSFVLGFSPRDLKAVVIGVTIQLGRMTLNNFMGTKLNGSIESLIGVERDLRLEPEDTENSPALARLDEAISQLYLQASSEFTVERVTESWLRRYLGFEIATYSAFMEQDKLFAIYKLFGDAIADRTYNEAEQVWNDLAITAQMEHMNKTESGPYGWLRELSVIGLESQESCRSHFFAENLRRRADLSSCDPRNYGVYAFPPQAAKTFESLTMETILLHADVAKQAHAVSYLVGFNLDERAAAKLGKKSNFTLVNKSQGGEIDQHLSLRGRKALGNFEEALHQLIMLSFSIPIENGKPAAVTEASSSSMKHTPPFVLQKNNGFFVLLRYHGLSNLCHCTVIRTASYAEHSWTIESIGCCTSEPMKGDSWGVARVVENLIHDFTTLESDHHQVEYVTRMKGTCAPYSGLSTINSSIPASTGGLHDEFFSWTVDGNTNHERGATTFHDGLLIKKESVEVGDLVVFGKTTFDTKTELNRLQKASQQIASQGATQETLSTYYNLLQRNYVHDSIMAQHLEYFGDLCEVLLGHVEKLPFLLDDPTIRQSFDYLCEDMFDALDMAGENGESEQVIEKARAALKKLSNAVSGMDD